MILFSYEYDNQNNKTTNLLNDCFRIIFFCFDSFVKSNHFLSDPSYNECHLLSDLCKSNAEILGDSYPELVSNQSRVNLILEFETESLKQLESEGEKLWPNFVKEYPKVI